MVREGCKKKQDVLDPADMRDNFAKKKHMFSAAAQTLLTNRLNGMVEINPDDIQLEIEGGCCGAIYITERISRNPYFQKMCTETSCINDLKKLACKAIQDIL